MSAPVRQEPLEVVPVDAGDHGDHGDHGEGTTHVVTALPAPVAAGPLPELSPDVAQRLDELRRLVEGAKSMPMSSSVMVHRSEVLDLIDGLEEALERAVADARTLVVRRDELLATGRDEARQLVHQAELEQEELVSDTEVFRVANRRAEERVAEAEQEASSLLEETDAWVEERLAAFEETLGTTLDAVRRGRERLAHKPPRPTLPSQAGAGPDPAHDPLAALADDSDVDAIVLPEHLER